MKLVVKPCLLICRNALSNQVTPITALPIAMALQQAAHTITSAGMDEDCVYCSACSKQQQACAACKSSLLDNSNTHKTSACIAGHKHEVLKARTGAEEEQEA